MIAARLLTPDVLRLVGGAGLVLGARVAAALLTLTYTLLITQVAAPEEVGRAFLALSAAFLVSVAASLNVEAGAIRFLPLYLGSDRTADAAGFVRWCRRTVLVIGATVLLPLGAILAIVGGDGTWAPFLIGLLIAPIVANTRINSSHAVALGLVLQATLPRILMRPALLTLVLLVAVARGWTLTATEIMAAVLAAACLTGLAQWGLIRHAMGFRHAAPPRFAEARDWVGLGLAAAPGLVVNQYLRDVVILAAGTALAVGDVARLGIALSFVGVLTFGLTAIDMVASPRLSRAMAAGRTAERDRLLGLAGAAKLAAFAVGAPLAWLLVPIVLDRMGAAYDGVEQSVLVLALIPLSKAVFGPAALVLNVLGRKRALLATALLGAAAIAGGTAAGGALGGFGGATMGAALAVAAHQALLWSLCRGEGIDTTAFAALRRSGTG